MRFLRKFGVKKNMEIGTYKVKDNDIDKHNYIYKNMTDEKLKEFARQAQTTINGSYADKSLYYQGLKSGYEQAETNCPTLKQFSKIAVILYGIHYDGKAVEEQYKQLKEHWED